MWIPMCNRSDEVQRVQEAGETLVDQRREDPTIGPFCGIKSDVAKWQRARRCLLIPHA